MGLRQATVTQHLTPPPPQLSKSTIRSRSLEETNTVGRSIARRTGRSPTLRLGRVMRIRCSLGFTAYSGELSQLTIPMVAMRQAMTQAKAIRQRTSPGRNCSVATVTSARQMDGSRNTTLKRTRKRCRDVQGPSRRRRASETGLQHRSSVWQRVHVSPAEGATGGRCSGRRPSRIRRLAESMRVRLHLPR